MYTKQTKKMLIISILEILKKYTDEKHRLSQKDIVEILEREYDMKVDRKSVKRNLLSLVDFGYDIEYTENVRINKNGEEETLYTDWYLEKSFTDSELRLLIDSLLFSKNIPAKQCKELIGKIEDLSNCYFKSRIGNISKLTGSSSENMQLFYTIDVLDDAISKGKKVAFYYNEYGIDKHLHPRKNKDGVVRDYIINPYQMAAVNGKYYLICNYDKYDDVSNYRLDRITNIRMLADPVKPMKEVKGLENGLNLSKHISEHIYMYTGESVLVKFQAKKYLLSELIDWFGTNIQFLEETEEDIIARVVVNLEAMRKWAFQYALHVKILSPEKLVESMRNDIKIAAERYDV